jgi:hypothetical protein
MADAPYCWINVLHCGAARSRDGQVHEPVGGGNEREEVKAYGALLGQGQIDASLSAFLEELLFSFFVGQQTLKGRHHELANHTPEETHIYDPLALTSDGTEQPAAG